MLLRFGHRPRLSAASHRIPSFETIVARGPSWGKRLAIAASITTPPALYLAACTETHENGVTVKVGWSSRVEVFDLVLPWVPVDLSPTSRPPPGEQHFGTNVLSQQRARARTDASSNYAVLQPVLVAMLHLLGGLGNVGALVRDVVIFCEMP
jgi:hypothetical protein